MTKAIYFDMDGTIANFYGVPNWLECLVASDPTPYKVARPLVNMNVLARLLNRLQAEGYELVVISWLCKNGTDHYNAEVTKTKLNWLNRHLPSVHWNAIHIVEYGTPKQMFCKTPLDVLFDDEEKNRTNWTGRAYDVNNILGVLREI
jgi:hypothetical protein